MKFSFYFPILVVLQICYTNSLTISGTQCTFLDSAIARVSRTDIPQCNSLLLPPGYSVASVGPGLVELHLNLYTCRFSFRTAVGLEVTEEAMVAHTGLNLVTPPNNIVLDLGSSTNNPRLVAAVLNAGFLISYEPELELHATPVSYFGLRSRANHGPNFAMYSSHMNLGPLVTPIIDYQQYFNTPIRGSVVSSFHISLAPSGTSTVSTGFCTDNVDGRVYNTDCNSGVALAYLENISVTQHSTTLVPATC